MKRASFEIRISSFVPPFQNLRLGGVKLEHQSLRLSVSNENAPAVRLRYGLVRAVERQSVEGLAGRTCQHGLCWIANRFFTQIRCITPLAVKQLLSSSQLNGSDLPFVEAIGAVIFEHHPGPPKSDALVRFVNRPLLHGARHWPLLMSH